MLLLYNKINIFNIVILVRLRLEIKIKEINVKIEKSGLKIVKTNNKGKGIKYKTLNQY